MWGGTSARKSPRSVTQDLRHLGVQRIHWDGGAVVDLYTGEGAQKPYNMASGGGTTVGCGENTVTEIPCALGVRHRAHKRERRVLPSIWETREGSLLREYHIPPPAIRSNSYLRKRAQSTWGVSRGLLCHLSCIRRQVLSTSPARH